MKPSAIDPNMPVDEIMRRWPATIGVMIRNRMLCIGCPIGIFHTVADACAAHGVDEAAFSEELLSAMRGDPATGTSSAFETVYGDRRAGRALDEHL
jgi:hybrid cluster-associated redox disulfide protein